MLAADGADFLEAENSIGSQKQLRSPGSNIIEVKKLQKEKVEREKLLNTVQRRVERLKQEEEHYWKRIKQKQELSRHIQNAKERQQRQQRQQADRLKMLEEQQCQLHQQTQDRKLRRDNAVEPRRLAKVEQNKASAIDTRCQSKHLCEQLSELKKKEQERIQRQAKAARDRRQRLEIEKDKETQCRDMDRRARTAKKACDLEEEIHQAELRIQRAEEERNAAMERLNTSQMKHDQVVQDLQEETSMTPRLVQGLVGLPAGNGYEPRGALGFRPSPRVAPGPSGLSQITEEGSAPSIEDLNAAQQPVRMQSF